MSYIRSFRQVLSFADMIMTVDRWYVSLASRAFLVLVICGLTPGSALAQYHLPATPGRLFPNPAGGVVLVPSFFPTQGFPQLFDANGFAAPQSDLPRTDELGDISDGVILADGRLTFATGSRFDTDVIESLPTGVLALNSNGTFDAREVSPFQLNPNDDSPWQVLLGSTTSGTAVLAQAGRLFFLDDTLAVETTLVLSANDHLREIAELAGLSLPQAVRIYLDGPLIASITSTRVVDLNPDGTIAQDMSYLIGFLSEWSDGEQSLVFGPSAYLSTAEDELRPYLAGVPRMRAVYDAGDRAVGLDDNLQLWAWRGDGAWEKFGNETYTDLLSVMHRPEGWYTLNGSELSYNPEQPVAPLVNPVRVSITVDSAATALRTDVPAGIYVWGNTLFTTTTLTNTSATDTLRSVIYRLLGPAGSFNPVDPDPYALFRSVEVLLPGETQILNDRPTYTLSGSGSTPPSQLSIQLCLRTIEGRALQAGERLCAAGQTQRVVGIAEQAYHASIVVTPNPSRGSIQLRVSSPVLDLTVYQLDGRLVQQIEGDGRTTLDVELPAGAAAVYLVRCRLTDGSVAVARVIVEP